MLNQWRSQIREVKGPKPQAVAIRAKFPKAHVVGKQILAWRAQEKIRHEASAYVKTHLLGRQINEREELNLRKELHRTVLKRVDAEMQAYLAGAEERKERLRDLLEAEEKSYIAEMELREETVEDRRNDMRLKAKLLRETREAARRKLVAEKQEQHFRESCEEVRTQWSKKHLLEVCEDRVAQLALKEEIKKQKEREEATFAALWEEDRLAKEKREAIEEQKRLARNHDMANIRSTQRAVADAQKEEAQRLMEEEAKLLEEERQLQKLEDERNEMERQKKQREWRDMLLDSMKAKMRSLSQAKEEELALDMKILDHVLQESKEDTEGQKQRKKELLKEQQIYRAYLAEQLEEDKRQEKEMEKLREEETAKMWAKRAEKDRAAKQARECLLQEVMDTRRLQIEEKLQRNAREQEALNRDKELLNAAIQEYNRLEEEKFARRVRQMKEYREALRAQMDHIQQFRDSEKDEERREYESALEAERLYQQKMADVLSRPYMKLKNLHPLRRQLACSHLS